MFKVNFFFRQLTVCTSFRDGGEVSLYPASHQEEWGAGLQGSQSVANKLRAVEARVDDLTHELHTVQHELYALKHAVKPEALTPHCRERFVAPSDLEIANRTSHCGSSTSRKNEFSHNLDGTNHKSGIQLSHSLGSTNHQTGDSYLADNCSQTAWEGETHFMSTGVSGPKAPAHFQDPWEGIFDFNAASIEDNTAEGSRSPTGSNHVGIDYHAVRFNVHNRGEHATPFHCDFQIDVANMHPHDGFNFQPEPSMVFGVSSLQADSLASGPSALQDNSDLDRALGIIPSGTNAFNQGVIVANSYAPNSAGPNIPAPQVQRRHLNRVRGTLPCPDCAKTFGRASDLERHYTSKHNPNPELFPCPEPTCMHSGPNGFARKDKLKQHRAKMGH